MIGVSQDILFNGDVVVHTTDNRGFTPEEIAERALDKIIYVGSSSHPAIRDQAEAFRENIKHVIVFYLKEAVKSDRTTLANRLREAGHPELTTILNF
jgi:signal transduction protein with GAF and PtsI domain